MNLKALFEKAMDLEKIQAELYEGLEKKFSFSDEISKFWSCMAGDEKNHYKYMTEIYNELSPDELSVEVSDDLYNMVCKGLNKLKLSRLEEVRDLGDACKLSSELEDYETKPVFKFVHDKFMRDPRLEISSMILAHLDKLAGFLSRFNSPDERKRIKAIS